MALRGGGRNCQGAYGIISWRLKHPFPEGRMRLTGPRKQRKLRASRRSQNVQGRAVTSSKHSLEEGGKGEEEEGKEGSLWWSCLQAVQGGSSGHSLCYLSPMLG